MLTIRLSRTGAKKRPFFHITVADSRMPRDGRFIEKVGYFNPIAKGKEIRLEVNKERVDYWLTQGAKVSDRVLTLFKENDETDEDKAKKIEKKEKKRLRKVAKKEAVKKEKESTAEETPAEEATEETPAEEATEETTEETPAEEVTSDNNTDRSKQDK